MVNEPRQKRSRERREALLRAAIELLAEGGARALTHRAVAARAGLPAASTTYYFDTIQQLTDEALALHVADRVADMAELVPAASVPGSSPLEVGDQVVEALVDRVGDVLVAQFEIYLEAARNPQIRPTVAEALETFEHFTAVTLKALGVRDPEAAAPVFVAMIDGFALHRVARPRPREEEVVLLRRAIRALFVAEIMSDRERERWDARMRRPLPG
jgi:DNA-binding transcriptional regulator YbjK